MRSNKLTEKFRTVGIPNPHNFYDGRPFICYRPRETGRMGNSPRWIVCKAGEKLSDAWYDYGAKTFLKWGDKKKSFAEAQAWASERFGIKEWARDPFGSYGEAEFVKARIKELVRKAGEVTPVTSK